MLIHSTEERIIEREGNTFVDDFFLLVAIVQEIPIMTPGGFGDFFGHKFK